MRNLIQVTWLKNEPEGSVSVETAADSLAAAELGFNNIDEENSKETLVRPRTFDSSNTF
jgi:hypothetical protein